MPAKRKSKPRSPDHAALGQAIELLIAEEADMTQDTVATGSGLNLRQVNNFIRGQGNPTYTTLLKLCKGLDVRLGELMTLTDELRDKRRRR
jgi:transcriptional regulator with XRE-family HTH domain